MLRPAPSDACEARVDHTVWKGRRIVQYRTDEAICGSSHLCKAARRPAVGSKRKVGVGRRPAGLPVSYRVGDMLSGVKPTGASKLTLPEQIRPSKPICAYEVASARVARALARRLLPGS